jgi:hypothetical protein
VQLTGGPAATDGQAANGPVDSGKGISLDPEETPRDSSGSGGQELVIEAVRVPEEAPWRLELTLPGFED